MSATERQVKGSHDSSGHANYETAGGRKDHHGWMMIACCIPMLVIAVALLAAGVVSVGFLVFAVACTAMMALMMRGMNYGSGHR